MSKDTDRFDFNSIKVRLKRTAGQLSQLGSEFQFHKGTIKTIRSSQRRHFKFHFNSIKVRLKLIPWYNAKLAALFQFHKGTIKTVTG